VSSGPPDHPAVPLSRPSTGAEERRAVDEVLASGWLAGQGPQGGLLEDGFRELTGRAHAVAVNNCTAGLHLALLALGVGPGDEVLVADYTFPATAHAVLFCGATPRFVDVRADTGTIDPSLVAELISERTRAIIGVDALGVPADWDELGAVAENHGISLVEDAACSAGGVYRDRPCGAFGDVAVFSLHARKGITSGEGGVVVTDDDRLAVAIRRASSFGMQSAFERQAVAAGDLPDFAELGYNYKLSDILAAIGRVQLRRLPELLEARARIAARYDDLLRDVVGLATPQVPADRTSTWQTYAVTLREGIDRDSVVQELRGRGIGATIGTYALSRLPVYGQRPSACPTSADLFARQLAIPMYADLSEEDQDRVVGELVGALGSVD